LNPIVGSNLEEEISIFGIIAENILKLASLYRRVDHQNLRKIQDATKILQETLDSRISKIDPSLRNGLE